MALKFTQKEIELEIAQILADGDITAISNISGIGYSYVDQQLNPNDSRRSCIYDALRVVCALDERSPERGEKVWKAISRRRELSKPAAAVSGASGANLNHESGELNREIAEYVSARISGKPFNEQISEFLDIERQLIRVKQALINEYNRLKSENPRMPDLKIVK